MQIEVFDVSHGTTDELNKFLRSHRILSNNKSFNPTTGAWSVIIEYLPDVTNDMKEEIKSKQENRVDYRKLLSIPDYAKFKVLKLCRKQIADEDHVPAYVVCVDTDLHKLVKMQSEDITMQMLSSLEGFGTQKQNKYGARFIKYWNEYKVMIPKYIKELEAQGSNIPNSDQH